MDYWVVAALVGVATSTAFMCGSELGRINEAKRWVKNARETLCVGEGDEFYKVVPMLDYYDMKIRSR